MPHVRSLPALAVAAVLIAAGAPAAAQEFHHGSVEFALLESVNFASLDHENATVLTFPTVSPAIRMTFWTNSPATVDFGLSFVNVSSGDNDNVSVVCLEGGVGADLGRKGDAWRPFFGGLLGYISVSEDKAESSPYLGVQFGVRNFVRDFAATRLQIGYRKTLGGDIDLGNIEIAGGVSFFL